MPFIPSGHPLLSPFQGSLLTSAVVIFFLNCFFWLHCIEGPCVCLCVCVCVCVCLSTSLGCTHLMPVAPPPPAKYDSLKCLLMLPSVPWVGNRISPVETLGQGKDKQTCAMMWAACPERGQGPQQEDHPLAAAFGINIFLDLVDFSYNITSSESPPSSHPQVIFTASRFTRFKIA